MGCGCGGKCGGCGAPERDEILWVSLGAMLSGAERTIDLATGLGLKDGLQDGAAGVVSTAIQTGDTVYFEGAMSTAAALNAGVLRIVASDGRQLQNSLLTNHIDYVRATRRVTGTAFTVTNRGTDLTDVSLAFRVPRRCP